MADSTAMSPRSVVTPAKLTGRKLRVSKAEKWARFCRLKIPGHYRVIFDVESNWSYRNYSLEKKTAHANKLAERAYPYDDRVIITEQAYQEIAEAINEDKNMALAIAIMFSMSFAGQEFKDSLDLMYSKAKDDRDPNKLISVFKWSLQFLEHMEHLKGLHQNIDKGGKGGNGSVDITPPV